jgi:quinol monooxygenase YgiN
LYALIGKFAATDGNQAALGDRLLEAAREMTNAPGCLQYLVYLDDADGVWVSEIRQSQVDHDASLDLPGVREFIRATMPLIAGMEHFPLTLLGGHFASSQ